jgi:murein DD-endopeptidase MepM/ murein hydrolase activator NlpD
MNFSKAVAAVCLVAAPSISSGDVYKYTDAEGTACFTDAPVTRDAILVMKERRNETGKAGMERQKGKKVPRHLAATGIADRLGAEPVRAAQTETSHLPVNGRVTSLVGLRHDPIDGKLRLHNGVDIAVREGTEVRPVAAGKVVFSGNRSGYGNLVIVSHPDGMITLYAHNSSNQARLGEQVETCTVIARSGSTGRSTGPHLHFEAWKENGNVTERFLGGIPRENLHEHSLPQRDRVRTAVQADGSILFTNLN